MTISVIVLVASAQAEVAQRRGVRVSVEASLRPDRLPRQGAAPVSISLSGRIGSASQSEPPQLREIAVAVNSHGVLRSDTVPRCAASRLSSATSGEALHACHGALVGEGRFSADIKVPEQTPLPSSGRLLAFNGRYRGSPAILAHIYGTKPFPTSFVLPFEINRSSGTYGVVLTASLPRVTGKSGFVTGISMTLNGPTAANRSYLTAGCPAPRGFKGVAFPLAKTTFSFMGGIKLTSVLNRSCSVDGRPLPDSRCREY